jgi:D-ribose pyranase
LVCSLPGGDVWVERGQDNGYTRKESRDTLSADLRARQPSPSFDFRPIVSSRGFRLGLIGRLLGCKGFSLMKKGGILNPAICSLLAELGQSDELLIVDAAYPLPTDGHVIDLTLTPGIPRLLDVLRAVSEELVIDSIAVPLEIKDFSPRIYQEILKIVGETDVDEVPFHEFKEQALEVKGIIRSAEFSPYASVRIVAGSAF